MPAWASAALRTRQYVPQRSLWRPLGDVFDPEAGLGRREQPHRMVLDGVGVQPRDDPARALPRRLLGQVGVGNRWKSGPPSSTMWRTAGQLRSASSPAIVAFTSGWVPPAASRSSTRGPRRPSRPVRSAGGRSEPRARQAGRAGCEGPRGPASPDVRARRDAESERLARAPRETAIVEARRQVGDDAFDGRDRQSVQRAGVALERCCTAHQQRPPAPWAATPGAGDDLEGT